MFRNSVGIIDVGMNLFQWPDEKDKNIHISANICCEILYYLKLFIFYSTHQNES